MTFNTDQARNSYDCGYTNGKLEGIRRITKIAAEREDRLLTKINTLHAEKKIACGFAILQAAIIGFLLSLSSCGTVSQTRKLWRTSLGVQLEDDTYSDLLKACVGSVYGGVFG
ncbi:unnamed protein product, partial [marine sediment metagenome]